MLVLESVLLLAAAAAALVPSAPVGLAAAALGVAAGAPLLSPPLLLLLAAFATAGLPFFFFIFRFTDSAAAAELPLLLPVVLAAALAAVVVVPLLLAGEGMADDPLSGSTNLARLERFMRPPGEVLERRRGDRLEADVPPLLPLALLLLLLVLLLVLLPLLISLIAIPIAEEGRGKQPPQPPDPKRMLAPHRLWTRRNEEEATDGVVGVRNCCWGREGRDVAAKLQTGSAAPGIKDDDGRQCVAAAAAAAAAPDGHSLLRQPFLRRASESASRVAGSIWNGHKRDVSLVYRYTYISRCISIFSTSP